MVITNPFRERAVILKRIQLRGILHVISLSNLAQRAGEETQQIPHSHVVSCGCRASQSGHVCRADCRCRYRRSGQVAAECARYGSTGDAVVFSPGVSLAEFTTKFEGVCADRKSVV